MFYTGFDADSARVSAREAGVGSRRLKGVLICATALAMCAGAAEAQRGSSITNVDWLTVPSGKDFQDYYPKLAAFLEVDGRATLNCKVSARGELADCTTVFEQPVGLGFGAAALAMTNKFAMRPQARNGIPVDGGTVTIPIRFALPEPRYPPPPPAAGEALRHALRITDAYDAVTLTLDKITQEHAATRDRGVTAATRAIVTEVLENAWSKRRGELRIAYANALASVFKESELAAIADFVEGPGKGLNDDRRMQDVQNTISASLQTVLGPSAKAVFCAKRSCPTPAELARVWRPADPGDDRIDNPQWANRPTATAISAAAPVPAVIGLSGAVRLTCRLEKEGVVSGCTVDEELPLGLGYGTAAQGLASRYRLSPIQAATSVEGRSVTLRVGFSPAAAGAPYVSPGASSDRSVSLARQILEDQGVIGEARKNLELGIGQLLSKPPAGVEQETFDAMLNAMRAGIEDALKTGLDLNAQAVASIFGEERLAAVLAFRTSTTGRQFEARKDEMSAALEAAYTPIGSAVAGQAKIEFCKLRSCVPTDDIQPGDIRR
jgi:TonB family protein